MAGKAGALSAKPTELPARYRPRGRFAWNLDRRCTVVRELAADLVELWQDLGGVDALSVQERALCDRIVFLRRRVIDYESAILHNLSRPEGQPERPLCMTHGEYSNHVNVLLGLLKALGIGRRQRAVKGLHEHLGSAS